jgi:hypothetical protein
MTVQFKSVVHMTVLLDTGLRQFHPDAAFIHCSLEGSFAAVSSRGPKKKRKMSTMISEVFLIQNEA